MISKRLKMLLDYSVSVSVIMSFEIFNVLKKNCTRSFNFKDALNFKEKVSAFIFESLSVTGYGKRLAWKSAVQNIDIRNIVRIDKFDVAFNKVFVSEVVSVSLACVLVNLISPNNLCSGLFKTVANTADTGE